MHWHCDECDECDLDEVFGSVAEWVSRHRMRPWVHRYDTATLESLCGDGDENRAVKVNGESDINVHLGFINGHARYWYWLSVWRTDSKWVIMYLYLCFWVSLRAVVGVDRMREIVKHIMDVVLLLCVVPTCGIGPVTIFVARRRRRDPWYLPMTSKNTVRYIGIYHQFSDQTTNVDESRAIWSLYWVDFGNPHLQHQAKFALCGGNV